MATRCAAILLLVACSAEKQPNCPSVESYDELDYRPDSTGAMCEIVISGGGNDARYSFPGLATCADSAAPVPCVVDTGSRPSVCEIQSCSLHITFTESDGQRLFEHSGATKFAYTVTCDGATVETGRLTPDLLCDA